MTQAPALRIAQVTDIHLFADKKKELLGLATADSFQAVLEKLEKLQSQLDLILLTGDLSQDGTVDSYQSLQASLAPLGIPTYWLPGNHDKPLVMQQVLEDAPISSQKSFQKEGWQFLLLDSSVFGHVHGQLSTESLQWLELQLEQTTELPTLVALHHPPFLVDSDWLDASKLQNSTDLFAVIDRYPQVKLVLFGHIHQEFSHQRAGVTYLGTPSTCVQFEPKSSNFSLDHAQPGFRLLHLFRDGTCKSWVERVTYEHRLDLAATGY